MCPFSSWTAPCLEARTGRDDNMLWRTEKCSLRKRLLSLRFCELFSGRVQWRRQQRHCRWLETETVSSQPRPPKIAPAIVAEPDASTDAETAADRLWNVIVWNDPINLMSYVTFVFQKLFGYSMEIATRLMLEVHHQGKSIVASVEREKAEYYVGRLHQFGLQATMEKQTP